MTEPLMITAEVVSSLWDLSVQASPNEVCGVLLGTESGVLSSFVDLHNYAPDPTQEFWMVPEEVACFVPHWRQVATWHSHPTGRWNLSLFDRQVMVKTQLPMAVVALKPWPSVALYTFDRDKGQIVLLQTSRVEGVTP